MSATLTPTAIQADRSKGLLTIDWNDGAQSLIPFMHLRDSCPCATCGEEAKEKAEADDALIIPIFDERKYNLESIEAVGNYAINPVWADGHRYGIFQWALLRRLGQDAS